jgi:hypothetical protein
MKEIVVALVHGLLAVLTLVACTEIGPPSGDITPPQVIEFTPNGEDIPIDSSITVRFSEPMSESLLQGQVVVLLSERVDAAFLKDIDSLPLSASRRAELVDCEISLDEDHILLSLKPKKVLMPGRAYEVVVSAAATDAAGNPLVKDINRDNHGMPVGQSAHMQHVFKTHTDAQAQNSSGNGVVLSEVQANPVGDDSQGEYIELICLSETPCDLTGYHISDQNADASSQSISACQTDTTSVLQPRQVALVVSRSFVMPSDVAPGATLLCVDGSMLTPYGLKNSPGETIVIFNSQGLEVTRYGGWMDFSTHEGCSAIRRDLYAADSQENWVVRTDETCRSPGRVD